MKRRLVAATICLLLSLFSCTPVPPPPPKMVPAVDKVKFEALYHSAKTVSGATNVGVSYVDFGKLLQSFATELDIAKEKSVNSDEKKLVDLYRQALEVYIDSQVVWKEKFSSLGDTWEGQIVVGIGNDDGMASPLGRIVTAYKIPVSQNRVKYTGTKWTGIDGDSASLIWQTASAKLDEANKFYYSEHEEISAK